MASFFGRKERRADRTPVPTPQVKKLNQSHVTQLNTVYDYIRRVEVPTSAKVEQLVTARAADFQRLHNKVAQAAADPKVLPKLRPLLAQLTHSFGRVDPKVTMANSLGNAVQKVVSTARSGGGSVADVENAISHCLFVGALPDVMADTRAYRSCLAAAVAELLPTVSGLVECGCETPQVQIAARSFCKMIEAELKCIGAVEPEDTVSFLASHKDLLQSLPEFADIKLRAEDFSVWKQTLPMGPTRKSVPEKAWEALKPASIKVLPLMRQRLLTTVVEPILAARDRGMIRGFGGVNEESTDHIASLERAFLSVYSVAAFLDDLLGAASPAADLVAGFLRPAAATVMRLHECMYPGVSCPASRYLTCDVSTNIHVGQMAGTMSAMYQVVAVEKVQLTTELKKERAEKEAALAALAQKDAALKAALAEKDAALARAEMSVLKLGGGGGGSENSPVRNMALTPGQASSTASAGSPFPGAGHWATTTFMPR